MMYHIKEKNINSMHESYVDSKRKKTHAKSR